MTQPLATVVVDKVSPLRFARIQIAAAKQLGQRLTGRSGTVTAHGADVSYSYDGERLTLNVLKVPTVFGRPLIQPGELQMQLLAWVQETT